MKITFKINKKVGVIFLLLFFAPSIRAEAAVVFNNTNTMQLLQFSNTITDSTNMSVTAGTDLVAFAVIAYDANNTNLVSSVSYGGKAMTSSGAAVFNAGTNASVEIWYLADPPTGLNTLSISISGPVPQDVYYNLVSFKNVNQKTPVRAGSYKTATGNAISGSVTITSNLNDLTLSATNSGGASLDNGNDTNQTEDGVNTHGGDAGASDHATTAATSVTHIWTYGAITNFAIAGFSIDGDPNTPPKLKIFGASGGRRMRLFQKLKIR